MESRRLVAANAARSVPIATNLISKAPRRRAFVANDLTVMTAKDAAWADNVSSRFTRCLGYNGVSDTRPVGSRFFSLSIARGPKTSTPASQLRRSAIVDDRDPEPPLQQVNVFRVVGIGFGLVTVMCLS
jgi:hypothetical protein